MEKTTVSVHSQNVRVVLPDMPRPATPIMITLARRGLSPMYATDEDLAAVGASRADHAAEGDALREYLARVHEATHGTPPTSAPFVGGENHMEKGDKS